MREEQKREWPGDLLRWVNQEPISGTYGRNTKASRKRLLTLIQALQTGSQELAARVERGPWRNYWNDPPKDLSGHLKAINELLSDYPTRPRVEILGIDGSGGLSIDYASTEGRALGEQAAVFAVIRLLKNGRLNAVLQCTCGRWFFAKRKDQKSCSAVCRHKLYEQTPEAKVKRKAYMQNYHRLRQSGKVK